MPRHLVQQPRYCMLYKMLTQFKDLFGRINKTETCFINERIQTQHSAGQSLSICLARIALPAHYSPSNNLQLSKFIPLVDLLDSMQ